jgi:hypothetical protein
LKANIENIQTKQEENGFEKGYFIFACASQQAHGRVRSRPH